jgi:hypothetical protein
MKKYFFLFIVTALLCASCKPETGSGGLYTYSYPSIVYTNDSSNWDITVKNAAKESYDLVKSESKTLNPDVRGRGDIIEIKPVYVTWAQNNGDMYDIRFRDRERFELEIQNYAPAILVLAERDGYQYPLEVEVMAAVSGTPGSPSALPVYVYTSKPVFELRNGSWQIKYKKSGDTLLVVIDPPDGWE